MTKRLNYPQITQITQIQKEREQKCSVGFLKLLTQPFTPLLF
jgi:hypothetical protein